MDKIKVTLEFDNRKDLVNTWELLNNYNKFLQSGRTKYGDKYAQDCFIMEWILCQIGKEVF